MRIVFSNNFNSNTIETHTTEINKIIKRIEDVRSKIFSRLSHANENRGFMLKLTAITLAVPLFYYVPGIISSAWNYFKGVKNISFFQNASRISNEAWRINTLFGAVGTGLFFGATYKKIVLDPYKGNVEMWRTYHREKLREFSSISDQYYEDPVLKEFICPLTLAPIRFPCTTPLGFVYECEIILSWLDNGNAVYPGRRTPLKVEDLSFDGDLYIKIKNRIQELQRSEFLQ